jgi:hypothetical protein
MKDWTAAAAVRERTVFMRRSIATLSWLSRVSCSSPSLRKSWKPSSESLSTAAIVLCDIRC